MRKDTNMKQKKFLLFAVICLSVITLPLALASCNSFAETEYAIVGEGLSFDNYIYDQYENSTIRITGIENMPSILVIPEKINGMTVVEIAEDAFAYNETLLYLEFPKGNIKLGKEFCVGNKALVCVNFSDTVTAIPENAFEDCINLALIEGTGGITAIGSQAFAGCSSLASIDFSEALASIGSEAFRGCTSLARIKLPSSVTSIGESAFWSCGGLAEVIFDCSTDIPEYCFLDCSSLASVKIGDGATAIKEEAFRNCRSLYSIEIGENCKTIGDYAFHACDSLTEIKFTNKSSITIGEGNESLGGLN